VFLLKALSFIELSACGTVWSCGLRSRK